jgi:S-adenosylmethionine hydrolase
MSSRPEPDGEQLAEEQPVQEQPAQEQRTQEQRAREHAARERPVIGFLTDFGLDGAAAICRGVMLGIARDAQIVDISHTVAKFAIRDGAYVLAAAVPWLPIGVHVAVVDPGVGTKRRPIALRTARGAVLVGPDNGLLLPAARALGGVTEARVIENRAWMLPATSSTFHGRDIFAPIAAHLAIGGSFADVGSAVEPSSLVELAGASARVSEGSIWTEVVYVDSFGNLRLAGRPADLSAALGPVEPGTALDVTVPRRGPAPEGSLTVTVRWSRTFGEAPTGELLAYEDSAGALAIAESSGSAARRLGLEAGARLGIRRA